MMNKTKSKFVIHSRRKYNNNRVYERSWDRDTTKVRLLENWEQDSSLSKVEPKASAESSIIVWKKREIQLGRWGKISNSITDLASSIR